VARVHQGQRRPAVTRSTTKTSMTRNQMKPRLAVLAISVLTSLLVAVPASGGGRPPSTFFGIDPQTTLTQADLARMHRGGIGSLRIPVPWSEIQPTSGASFDWSQLDSLVNLAEQNGVSIFPFVYSTPHWVAAKPTTLPVSTAEQRGAWQGFLHALVNRYGPGGSVGSIPIRNWQIWNEENFFPFAQPVSAAGYAKLVKLSAAAIRAEDPGAKVILGGLFARPKGKPSRAQSADSFLNRLYRSGGIKASFDGVALHPYAPDTAALRRYTEDLRAVVKKHGDGGTPLYITEMGWGSQSHSKVSFEKGPKGQSRELRDAYGYLIKNRGKLNLRGVYWFSWKDTHGTCNFCDSVGLFKAGSAFKPKPAWFTFVKFTGGRP
jgi:hypothetical protein